MGKKIEKKEKHKSTLRKGQKITHLNTVTSHDPQVTYTDPTPTSFMEEMIDNTKVENVLKQITPHKKEPSHKEKQSNPFTNIYIYIYTHTNKKQNPYACINNKICGIYNINTYIKQQAFMPQKW